MLSQATVTGFVDTVKGTSQLYSSSSRVMNHPNAFEVTIPTVVGRITFKKKYIANRFNTIQ